MINKILSKIKGYGGNGMKSKFKAKKGNDVKFLTVKRVYLQMF